MPVRLDHYQNIVNVHWPENDLFIQLNARLFEIGSNGYPVANAPATDLGTIGFLYAGSFRNIELGNIADDFLFESFSVLNSEGGIAGDEEKVSISGQATINLGSAPPIFTTEDVPADTVATAAGFRFDGGAPSDENTGSGTLKTEYSGTAVGLVDGETTFFSDYYQEQVTIRAKSKPIDARRYWDPDGAMPLDPSVLFLGLVNEAADFGECSHFNPVSGVTVTYDGRPCTFVASFADWQPSGPPVGTHIYRAVFRVPPP